MARKKTPDTVTGLEKEGAREPAPPPYNDELDPDNATSPLDFEERQELGRELFYPEGGPEDPPVRDFEEDYDLRLETRS